MPAVPAGITSRVAQRHAFSRFTSLVIVSLFSTSSNTTSDGRLPCASTAHPPASSKGRDHGTVTQFEAVLAPHRSLANSVGVITGEVVVGCEFVADVAELLLRLPRGVRQDEGERLVPFQGAVKDVGQGDDGGLGTFTRGDDRFLSVAAGVQVAEAVE